MSWLAALFAGNAADQPQLTPVDVDGAFDGMPVIRWSVPLPGIPAATATRSEPAGPTVDAERIYIGASGVSGLLILDRRNGDLVDTLPARAPIQAPVWVGDAGLIVCDGAGYTTRYVRDGKRWKKRWEHFSGSPILSAPTVKDGVIYLANVDDEVYALGLEEGELRWRHEHKLDVARSAELELYGAASPVIMGEAVFVGFSDGFLVALSAADGTSRWEVKVGEGAYPDLIAPAAVADGGVITGGFSEPLLMLAPGTRSAAWRLPFGVAAGLHVDGAYVYAGGTDGKLRKIEARTGEVVWEWDGNIAAPIGGTGGVLGKPLATPVGLFVPSSEGTLNLIDAQSGALKWRLDPGVLIEGISAAPVLSGRDLFVVTNGGRLYDLRANRPDPVISREDWVSPRSRR